MQKTAFKKLERSFILTGMIAMTFVLSTDKKSLIQKIASFFTIL
jgi:hypothetical protein